MKVQQRSREKILIRTKIRVPLITSAGREMTGEVHTFSGLSDGLEHLAIGLGNYSAATRPLVRIHSECLTGDVLGSARCDCGPQLHESLERISERGGVLLYMRQEGRGIGLYNKLDAYALQDLGYDTFEANRQLEFADDERDYRPAAQMLEALGITHVDVLTNNPDKVVQLRRHGIHVYGMERTGVFLSAHNRRYLEAKVRTTRHELAVRI
ncbi:GTP cyclohydrolase II [Kibdelosporangium persicum]|uniref:GTP cyclohydrolase II n=1 Tax=Kibdelosporangium persicum TaxID=2698649 RepID=A0ABX2FFM1_9PSEU|nr:GTP cyclohydrolase II [Kibdelosporangium persicum]NRN69525.1 GTP cyclohydrolase II [Kibdelosporangium persicum]